ncbi:MAG TPA: MIP/aquaporin family protein [Terriglobales bacterium]|jgi:glycerol uptake facilitator protein|nr:MIP/aquaporin family protein [Terriglobales bacterium]
MTSPLLGEFMGTMVLILLGNGCVANVLLKHSKAHGSGWIVITTGWAFAVMSALFVAIACGSREANINPAVTLGLAVISGDYSKVVSYSLAQMLGAFVGAILVWIHFGPHWKQTEEPETKLLCFCGVPAIRNLLANTVSEIICTFILVFVSGAIFSQALISSGWVGIAGPYLIGCLVWGIGLSLGGTTGYGMNPARDLPTRLAHTVLPIAGKGSSDWSYAAVPFFGPLIGASLAGLFIRFLHW